MKYSKGYTLLEILIVISITGLIFGVGYAGFREFSRRQAVVTSTRAIKEGMRLAQQQAISGKKPEGCNATLDGYSFEIINSEGYVVSALCGVEVVVKEMPIISTGVTINPSFPNPIIFKSLGAGTNIPNGQESIIEVVQESSGHSQQIRIGANGEIN